MKIVLFILNILIIGLFLYSKLLPYKEKLDPNYRKVFDFFNNIFSPIFIFLKNLVKPFQIGVGLFIDMSQIVLLIILLIFINLF